MSSETNEQKALFHFRVYDTLWTSGLAARLDPPVFKMLLTLGRHMNSNWECWPSQEYLATELGVSVTTVSNHIQKLLKFVWNGQPLVTAKKHPKWGNYVYRIHPISQIACGRERRPAHIEPESTPTVRKRVNDMTKARAEKAERRLRGRAEDTMSNPLDD